MNRRTPKLETSRQLAFVALDDWSRTGEFPTQRLDELAPLLPPQERGLAMELVYGVVRRRGTLDALIQPHVSRSREQIESGLWTLLRIGAYQLCFLDGVPVHAAVHETVEVARHMGEPQWTGFVNAVLRKVATTVTAEVVTAPASDAVPLTEGRYRRVAGPILPDPARDPAAYLADAFSLPRWLVDRWSRRNGMDELLRLGFWFNTPSPVWIRVNPANPHRARPGGSMTDGYGRAETTESIENPAPTAGSPQSRNHRDEPGGGAVKGAREVLRRALMAAGVSSEPGQVPASLRLERATGIESLPGFSEGWFTVQDESAMHAALLLDPQPGETVLDLCAAPGTKTTHLAELMRNQGRLVATDIRTDRLARISKNARRLGLDVIETRLVRDDASDLPDELFDAILVDVPCSNTGVLGRRPEVRWRLEPTDIRELTELQTRLIAAAAKRLKPGGRLVYSTCSIEPEENQGVVRGLLDRRKDFALVREKLHVPGRPADGGYLALLRKAPDPAPRPPSLTP